MITSRSKINVRWSTAPRHVGYAANHEKNDLAEMGVDFRGTPRQCVQYMERVGKNVGQGTFMSVLYTDKNNQPVSRDTIFDVANEAENRREYLRYAR